MDFIFYLNFIKRGIFYQFIYFGNFFILTSYHEDIFIFQYSYVFWPVESKSHVQIFRIIGSLRCRPTKIDTWFGRNSGKKKKKLSSISSIRKISLSRKFRVDNSKCHEISYLKEKRKKLPKCWFLNRVVYFNLKYLNLFLSAGTGSPRLSGKTYFPDYR